MSRPLGARLAWGRRSRINHLLVYLHAVVLEPRGHEAFVDESNCCGAGFFYPLGIGIGIGRTRKELDLDPDTDTESVLHGSLV
jgi:hypothetical protein